MILSNSICYPLKGDSTCERTEWFEGLIEAVVLGASSLECSQSACHGQP